LPPALPQQPTPLLDTINYPVHLKNLRHAHARSLARARARAERTRRRAAASET
jgi:hypothetical protein